MCLTCFFFLSTSLYISVKQPCCGDTLLVNPSVNFCLIFCVSNFIEVLLTI